MSQETIEKTFNISGQASLKLTNIRGSVEVRPGEADQIQISVIKHLDSGDAQNTEIELSQTADGSVLAATHFPEGWWSWLLGSKPCRVDYVVKMPQAGRLKLRGVENSVFVDGLEAEFDLASVSGELSLRNLLGPVKINTVSGDVSIGRVSGSLDLVTVSGDLNASDARLNAINAKTVSGHLSLQTPLAEGPYKFDSVSGDVRLLLPAETRCSARLRTVSGEITSTFPGTDFLRSHGTLSIEIQGGGVPVTAGSVSGNLQLYPSGGSAPHAAEKAPAGVDRREILARIERGEISAAEALEQLKA
jgi:hypothetical protein